MDASNSSSMSSLDSGERNIYHFVLYSATMEKFLALLETLEQLALPTVFPLTTEVCRWRLNCETLGKIVEHNFGVKGTVLGPLRESREVDELPAEELVLVFDVAHIERMQKPDKVKWISEKDICKFLWKPIHRHVHTRQMLLNFFHTETFWQASFCQPVWRTIGWAQHLNEWIYAVLAARKFHVANIIYVRNTDTSAIMAVEACETQVSSCTPLPPKQRFYVKTGAHGSREAVFTKKISSFANEYVPQVVAVHENWNSFIQHNAGELHFSPDPDAMLMALARLQKLSMGHLEDLKKLGMQTYTLKWITINVEPVLRDILTRHCSASTATLNLVKFVSSVQRLCEELDAEGFPVTLVHGDLHLRNIAKRHKALCLRTSYSFIDWGSAFMGHPLIDVFILLNSLETSVDMASVLEHYFQILKWRGPPVRVKRMVNIAGLCYWFLDLYISVQGYPDTSSDENYLVLDVGERLIRMTRAVQSIERA